MPATLECDPPSVRARPARKAAPQPRQQSINIRVMKQQVTVIDQAASALGQTRSAFMLEQSMRAAEAVLLDKRLFVVDDATYEAFQAVLDAPVTPNPKLAALLHKAAPWEK